MSGDRLEITVHFKDGEFPRELVLNRAGREVDHVIMDGGRLESVVRCRDCAYCMAYMAGTYCDYMAHAIEPDGFCAWAERKEGGDGLDAS